MYDTEENENSCSDLSGEEVNVIEEVPLSPQSCPKSMSSSMPRLRKTSKRKKFKYYSIIGQKVKRKNTAHDINMLKKKYNRR